MDRLAVEKNFALRMVPSVQGEQELGLALALESADAEHLALPDGEVDGVKAGAETQRSRLEDDLVLRRLGNPHASLGQLPADHQLDQLLLGELGHQPGRDALPRAEDGTTVGELVGLAEAVRDHEHGCTVGDEAPDDLDEPEHVLARQ